MTAMIEVTNLSFDYPGVRALDNVSFAVQPRDVVALVGPNGAGKTTLLRCLAALDQPVSGTISVDGVDVLADPRACHRRVGYLADFFGLYAELTVSQCLTYVARAHNIPAGAEKSAVLKAAERLYIADRLSSKVGTLSRGLSQRLAIAQAIIHEPAVLLLDEPASGLDPEARKLLSQLFLELRDQGMTLIVSSHILAELEEYCTSMLIVRDGRIVEHRPSGAEPGQRAAMRLELSEPFEGLEAALDGLDGVEDVRVQETAATFTLAGGKGTQYRLLRTLLEHGIPVCAFAEQKARLQDAYLAHAANRKGDAQ